MKIEQVKTRRAVKDEKGIHHKEMTVECFLPLNADEEIVLDLFKDLVDAMNSGKVNINEVQKKLSF